jgi:hypothetical protein
VTNRKRRRVFMMQLVGCMLSLRMGGLPLRIHLSDDGLAKHGNMIADSATAIVACCSWCGCHRVAQCQENQQALMKLCSHFVFSDRNQNELACFVFWNDKRGCQHCLRTQVLWPSGAKTTEITLPAEMPGVLPIRNMPPLRCYTFPLHGLDPHPCRRHICHSGKILVTTISTNIVNQPETLIRKEGGFHGDIIEVVEGNMIRVQRTLSHDSTRRQRNEIGVQYLSPKYG